MGRHPPLPLAECQAVAVAAACAACSPTFHGSVTDDSNHSDYSDDPMRTPIQLRQDRCDLCGGSPACVPACPQQILAIRDDSVVMTHSNRCPSGCSTCIDECGSDVFSLVEQVHQGLGAVPHERIDGAALVHHVAYQRDEAEPEYTIRGRFASLLDELGIPEPNRSLGDSHAHGWGRLAGADSVVVQLTWELHTEYYFVRAILSGPLSDSAPILSDLQPEALEPHMERIVPILHGIGAPPLVTCLDIYVSDRSLNMDEVCGLISCRNRFGNRVLGGEVAVYTNYEPVNGRERYVVAAPRAVLSTQGGFVIGNIGRIENYYHLLMIPRAEERTAIQDVHRVENELAARSEAVTLEIESAGRERLEQWLQELTLDLTRLVRLNSRFNHVLSATFPYGERVSDGFSDWKAEPVDGFEPLDGMILDRVDLVIEEYHAFLTRLGRMQTEISALVSILRTRVELTMEAQNSQMLQNLDKRSAIQLRLQELAEGLSVIVITYYMTGLVSYFFKALEKQHLIGDGMATLFSAVFIPFGAFGAYTIAHRAVHRIKKQHGKDH